MRRIFLAPPAFVLALLLLAGLSEAQAASPPPHAETGAYARCESCHVQGDSLRYRVQLKEPPLAADQDVKTIRGVLDALDGALRADFAQQHPPRDVACADCHKAGKLGQFHEGLVMDEESPDATCGLGPEGFGCHALSTVKKTPWWSMAVVELSRSHDGESGPVRGLRLLADAAAQRPGLAALVAPAGEAKEVKLNTYLDGAKFVASQGAGWLDENLPLRGPAAQELDGLVAALDALNEAELAALSGVPTSVEAKAEYTAATATEMAPEIERVNADLAPLAGLAKDPKIEVKWKPVALPASEITAIAADVDAAFPEATGKTVTATKTSWTLGSGTIVLERKDATEAKLAFEKVESAYRARAMALAAGAQERNSRYVAEFAKFESKYVAAADADKELVTDTLAGKIATFFPSHYAKYEMKVEAKGDSVAETPYPQVAALQRAMLASARDNLHELRAEAVLTGTALAIKNFKFETRGTSAKHVLSGGSHRQPDPGQVLAVIAQSARPVSAQELVAVHDAAAGLTPATRALSYTARAMGADPAPSAAVLAVPFALDQEAAAGDLRLLALTDGGHAELVYGSADDRPAPGSWTIVGADGEPLAADARIAAGDACTALFGALDGGLADTAAKAGDFGGAVVLARAGAGGTASGPLGAAAIMLLID